MVRWKSKALALLLGLIASVQPAAWAQVVTEIGLSQQSALPADAPKFTVSPVQPTPTPIGQCTCPRGTNCIEQPFVGFNAPEAGAKVELGKPVSVAVYGCYLGVIGNPVLATTVTCQNFSTQSSSTNFSFTPPKAGFCTLTVGAGGSSGPMSGGGAESSGAKSRFPSKTIQIEVVDTGPEIRLTSPSSNAVFEQGAEVTISATPSVPSGLPFQVEFEVQNPATNQTLFRQKPVLSPYSIKTSSLPAGSHRVIARVSTGSGTSLKVDSDTRAITVRARNLEPSISILKPVETEFIAPASFDFEASASDPDGTIKSVVLKVEKIPLGSGSTWRDVSEVLTAAPYVLPVSINETGSYRLTAVATDDRSATKTVTKEVTVRPNTRPTISWVVPAGDLRLTRTETSPVSLQLVVSAQDADGPIKSVQFFRRNGSGGVLPGQVRASTQGRFELDWNNLAVGDYTIFAKVDDHNGGSAETPDRVVRVSLNSAPSVDETEVIRFSPPPVPTPNELNRLRYKRNVFASNEIMPLRAVFDDTDKNLTRVVFYRMFLDATHVYVRQLKEVTPSHNGNGKYVAQSEVALTADMEWPTMQWVFAIAYDTHGAASRNSTSRIPKGLAPVAIHMPGATSQPCGGEGPYCGPTFGPHEMPGRLESEHYDVGGAGVGYFDADPFAPDTMSLTPFIGQFFDKFKEELPSQAEYAEWGTKPLGPRGDEVDVRDCDDARVQPPSCIVALRKPGEWRTWSIHFRQAEKIQIKFCYRDAKTPSTGSAGTSNSTGGMAEDVTVHFDGINPSTGQRLELERTGRLAPALSVDNGGDSLSLAGPVCANLRTHDGSEVATFEFPQGYLGRLIVYGSEYGGSFPFRSEDWIELQRFEAPIEPSIAIERPLPGAEIQFNGAATQPVRITAAVSAPQAPRVRFSVRPATPGSPETTIAELGSAPYEVDWQPASPGAYVLRASFVMGGRTYASEVAVTVKEAAGNQRPSAELLQPAAGTIAPGTNLSLRASAADPDGTVARVEFVFRRNGADVGARIPAAADPAFPGQWTASALSPTVAGDYDLFAIADDSATPAARGESAAVRITVANVDGPAPTLSLANVGVTAVSSVAPANVSLSAEPSGGVAPITVEYFVNDRSLGVTEGAGPHMLHWRAAGPGTHTIRIEASDSSQPPQRVSTTRQLALQAPAPAQPPARTSVDQESDGVGTLAGSFRVDESGAATYAIPLTLPPGRGGATPQLGFAYSSQAGDGSLGRGWSISGLSNIARCRRTREAGDFAAVSGSGAQAELFDGITFTDEDAFCLDGQRLVDAVAAQRASCSVVQGYASAEMRTEVDSQRRICAYRSNTTPAAGPRFFSVESKDGQRRWYGMYNGQTQLQADGEFVVPVLTQGDSVDGPIYLWALNRSLDSVKNYTDYRYIADYPAQFTPSQPSPAQMGALLIRSIGYAGNVTLGLPTHSEVRFDYELALQRDQFVSGRRFSTSKRLKSVEVWDGGSVQRIYDLSYLGSPLNSPYDGRSRHLQSIQECVPRDPAQPTSARLCLRPTTFNYGGSDPASGTPATEHAGLDRAFGTAVELEKIQIGSVTKFEGKKIADIDGDGLLDIVWVKDLEQNDVCPAPNNQVGVTGTDLINVAFLRHTGSGSARSPSFDSRPALCTSVELQNRTSESGIPPDEAWFLYDYNRDGKSDLFYRGATRWQGYLATGDSDRPFDLSDDVLATVAIPHGEETRYFPRPVDLNADGLMDLVRVQRGQSGAQIYARLFQSTPLAGGSSPAGWRTELPVVFDDACGADPDLRQCSATLVGIFDEDGFERQIDLNGDGATDLFLAFDVSAVWPPSSGGGGPGDPGFPPRPHNRPETATETSVRRMWVPMRVVQVSATEVRLAPVRGMWTWGGVGRNTQHIDLNGDGLTDTATILADQSQPLNAYGLNTGSVIGGVRPTGRFHCDLAQQFPEQKSAGLSDITGDGLPDYYAFEGGRLRVYPNTGGHEKRTSTGATQTCNSLFSQQAMEISADDSDPTRLQTWDSNSTQPSTSRQELLFGDWDGDGLTDLLVLAFGGDAHLYVSHVPRVAALSEPRETRRADPPGLLTAITDGLGGRTGITYRPLSNPAVYRADRTTNDAAYGRGSAVHDVRAAINVVAKVETSAPSFTQGDRKARLYYRYVGAKMQTGGRGLLGFREIHTIDPNHSGISADGSGAFAMTISTYRQQFPFIGLPDTTERWVVGQAWQESDCFRDGMLCTGTVNDAFASPDAAWPADARLLSDATEDYVFAWASAPSVELPHFNGQGRGPESVLVRRIRSEEHTYDLHSGARVNASVQLYHYLPATGAADAFGNVMRTRSYVFADNPEPSHGGTDYSNSVSRVETLNTYLNDVSADVWYPGRLATSTVTHQRSGQADVTRESKFTYVATGPTRGLLRSEEVYATGAYPLPQTANGAVQSQRDERLKTFHTYDSFGNRSGSYSCDTDVSEAQCLAPTQQDFAGTSDALRVQRWSRTRYDENGRFVHYTESAYANGERRDSEVLAHTAYGQPLLVRDLNGGYTRYAYGRFGRSAYQWVQTVASKTDPLGSAQPARGEGPGLALGVESRTRYAWCAAAGGSAICPAGAVYMETVEATAQPRRWTYFDALARPVLQAGELLGADSGEGAVQSATCHDYDIQGRSFRQSVPRALASSDTPDSAALREFCASVPAHHWSETEFDVLGRSIAQYSPGKTARSRTTIAYSGRVTTTTLPTTADARSRVRIEERNVLGELVKVSDGENLGAIAVYTYSATGDLLSVVRTGAGVSVTSAMYYDRMGRKIRTEDPDAGVWNYRYNAAGDLIAQYDGDYLQPSQALPTTVTRTEQAFDGRGRVVSKGSYAANRSTGVIHRWTYDTAPDGKGGTVAGALASESSEGSYDGTGESTVYFDRVHRYDALGRAIGSGTRLERDGARHEVVAHYDAFGRTWKTLDASRRWLKTEYGPRGFQLAQCESLALDAGPDCAANHPDTYIRVLAVDAWGKVTLEQRGQGVAITSNYEAGTGRLTSRCMGSSQCDLQLDTYDWDALGNLLWRERRASTAASNLYSGGYARYRETFTYDSLNRVTDGQLQLFSTVTGTQPVHSAGSLVMRYDALGNVCQRSVNGTTLNMRYLGSDSCSGARAEQATGGAGSFASPHALTRASANDQAYTQYAYDAHGNQIRAERVGSHSSLPTARRVDYTAEQQAWRMVQESDTTRFFHGPDGARYQRIDQGSGATVRTHYLGNVELVLTNATPLVRRYVAGVAMMEIDLAGTVTVKRLLHDHLGSVSLVVSNNSSDSTRTVLERYDYDAFGQRRAALGDPRGAWSVVAPQTNRGFTGHEMLDAFGLVHMNGRVYDSRTARFLQADPFVQEPNNPQNFNRFTYLWNNPLNATDPSGFLGVKERQAVAVIYTIVAVATQQYWALSKTGAFFYAVANGAIAAGISTQSWNGAMWGAFSAAAFYGVGEWLPSEGVKVGDSMWYQRVVAHGFVGGTMSVAQGGKFGHGFVSAGASAGSGPWIDGMDSIGAGGRIAVAALVGGTVSAATGGKFANGAVTAAFSQAFNGEQPHGDEEVLPGCRKGQNCWGYTVKPEMSDGEFAGFLAGFVGGGWVVKGLGWVRGVWVGRAAGAAASSAPRMVRVGRWMDEVEHASMVRTGTVQAPRNGAGATHVTVPPNPAAWTPPNSGRVFVEFDVPAAQLRIHDISRGHGRVFGPQSLEARMASRLGQTPPTAMPPAANITVRVP